MTCVLAGPRLLSLLFYKLEDFHELIKPFTSTVQVRTWSFCLKNNLLLAILGRQNHHFGRSLSQLIPICLSGSTSVPFKPRSSTPPMPRSPARKESSWITLRRSTRQPTLTETLSFLWRTPSRQTDSSKSRTLMARATEWSLLISRR